MNSNQFICPECEREDVDSWVECPSCTGADFFEDKEETTEEGEEE